MFGAAKYAQRLANHLDAPVDAACMIDERSGVGGRPDGGRERPRGRVGWLAVGPDAFTVVGGERWMGRPVGGAPVAVVAYAAVARVRLTSSHTTTRAHVELVDARSFEFEVERGGPTPDGEVLELLAARCGSRS